MSAAGGTWAVSESSVQTLSRCLSDALRSMHAQACDDVNERASEQHMQRNRCLPKRLANPEKLQDPYVHPAFVCVQCTVFVVDTPDLGTKPSQSGTACVHSPHVRHTDRCVNLFTKASGGQRCGCSSEVSPRSYPGVHPAIHQACRGNTVRPAGQPGGCSSLVSWQGMMKGERSGSACGNR